MIRYTPGVQVQENFIVPDEDGDNIAGLTWTGSLFKDGQPVTSGVEYDSLSCEGVGSPPAGYLVSFTPVTDGAVYDLVFKSDQGDAWIERLESHDVKVEGAPSITNSVFKVTASLVSEGKLVDCASATAVLYRGDDQDTVVKNLGSGSEGTLNAFAWSAASVTVTTGYNYFIRFTFTVASPGSPATPVTIVRDLSFSV